MWNISNLDPNIFGSEYNWKSSNHPWNTLALSLTLHRQRRNLPYRRLVFTIQPFAFLPSPFLSRPLSLLSLWFCHSCSLSQYHVFVANRTSALCYRRRHLDYVGTMFVKSKHIVSTNHDSIWGKCKGERLSARFLLVFLAVSSRMSHISILVSFADIIFRCL